MKRIEELLSTASPQELSRAKRLLQSNQFLSAKFIDDAGIQTFEAMITYRNGILMPYFMVGDDHALVCQCSNHAGLCVHKIALLLAASVCWKKTARITTQLSSKELQTR